MGYELFQSRRNQNEYCVWWSRNDSENYDEDELIYKRTPSGYFYAKEINAVSQDDNTIGGIFMADKTTTIIMSSDDLSSLYNQFLDVTNKVLIKYQGEIWRVDNVQKRKARIQNTEFGHSNEVAHYWYLSLIKG